MHDIDIAKVGDHVQVVEVESPWVHGPWVGVVKRLFSMGDLYVQPLRSRQLSYRVKPSKEYLKQGLYLTRHDRIAVVRVAKDNNRHMRNQTRGGDKSLKISDREAAAAAEKKR